MKGRTYCLKHVKLKVKFLHLLFVMLLGITAVEKNIVQASEYDSNSNLVVLLASTLFLASEKKSLPEIFETDRNNHDQNINVYYGSDVSTNFLPRSLYTPGKVLREQTTRKQKIEDGIDQREQMMKIISCEEASGDTHYSYLQSLDGITPEERREIESRLKLGQDEDENRDDSKLAPAFSLLSVNGSDSFPVDTSLCTPETAAACQTILSSFISCVLPGATEGGGAATDHNTMDEEASEPESDGFSCHELTYTRRSAELANLENEECPVCLGPYKPEEPCKPEEPPEALSLLKCQHLIHKNCMLGIVNKGEGNPACPTCRVPFAPSDAEEHSDWKSIKGSLRVRCTRPSCFAHGSEDTVNSPSMACPYPMSQLPDRNPENFIENNAFVLAKFLKESFEQMIGTKVGAKIVADEGEGTNIYFRALYRSGSTMKMQSLIYRANDINNKKDGQECLNTLVKDHFTDLMVLYMKKSFPATWDDRTEMYLYTWDVYEDRLYLAIHQETSKKTQLKLSNVFDLTTRTLNWDGLRKEMEDHGLPYEKLFSSEGRFTECCLRAYSDSDYDYEEPPVEIPVEMPSGEMQIVDM
ncbi:RING finger protein [Endozoicomonas euniceicola]|uniref:RING finger protein n=1 Tax=Endozoicomonas euniceicola TaxID=1234143 RepID=A0ABY6GSB5_9GAMM|nr:RING finger protein [Endozoicomonas euniceicola]UYM14899.1 RING finger protein [Endozoicomonas euniceicola]